MGDFGKDPTPRYWLIALPALTMRYAVRFMLRLFDYEQRAENLRKNPKYEPWIPKSHVAYPLLAGTIMASITGFFARRTYQDMKTLFGETVAFEFNKAPEQVTIKDLYKSQNLVVKTTMKNFIKFNVRRFLADSLFFMPWTKLHDIIPGGKSFL